MGATPVIARGPRKKGPAGGARGATGGERGDALDRDDAPSHAAADAGARARIALVPRGARRTRARLFAALEQAYPVSFKEPPPGGASELAAAGFDGVLTIGGEARRDLPPSLPSLHALREERAREGAAAGVALAAHDALARPLRGARLTDRWTAPVPGDALAALPPGYVALATLDGSPAWLLETPGARGAATAAGTSVALEPRPGAHRELVAAAPAELEPGEALRERLAPGRCLALLALVHFLRRVVGLAGGHASPPLHAAFVLDDPNLHSPRYGHLHYAELARHALTHGYHMAIAMPPIDGWFAHPRAARVFREHPAQLSLCVHGNDHLGAELGRIQSTPQGVALARQALVRAASFERRTGIPFERIMVPPHEQLTEPAARGLRAAGFAGTCVSRPYPWIAPQRPGPAAALSAGPPERGARAGWEPAELVAGGLPVLLRTGFNAPREDLVLRAFLGQPLIVYGHHDTLAGGLDVLADSAAAIDALGDVRWGSLAAVARGVVAGSSAGTAVGSASVRADMHKGQAPTRPRLRPLLRRLASEARDRARV